MAKDYDDTEMITLEFEDGNVEECEVMGVFPYGDKDYIAVIPQNDTDDIYLYHYQEYDDGTYDIESIDDTNEFRNVCAEFDRIMSTDDEEAGEE